MQPDTTSAEFFEAKYLAAPDPWQFASDGYELGRYHALIRSLGGRRFRSVFEPGCSIGVLTEMLASIAEQVMACDFSARAAATAQARCESLPNVTVRCAALTCSEPWANFDLVVLSEIGYYFSRNALHDLLQRMVDGLQPGATMLACHWLGYSPDHVLSGDAVHHLIAAQPGLLHCHGERHGHAGLHNGEQAHRPGGFRLDLWSRR